MLSLTCPGSTRNTPFPNLIGVQSGIRRRRYLGTGRPGESTPVRAITLGESERFEPQRPGVDPVNCERLTSATVHTDPAGSLTGTRMPWWMATVLVADSAVPELPGSGAIPCYSTWARSWTTSGGVPSGRANPLDRHDGLGAVLKHTAGMPDDALDALADLERRVVAADGGRLKLEWSALRTGQDVESVLWWDKARLLGFLGIYTHSAPVVELAGMVDPTARRYGIGTALLNAALGVCRKRGYSTMLLIVPRTSTAGRALALDRSATPHHSEHVLQLRTEPHPVPADPRTMIRPATTLDLPAVHELIHLGFGWQPPASDTGESDQLDQSAELHPGTLVIERDGGPIGTVRLEPDRGGTGIYGFVIHPDHRGHGIGRDVLHRLCRQARADGAAVVSLEVACDNDRALHLYTSLGFQPVATDDYYALPGGAPREQARQRGG